MLSYLFPRLSELCWASHSSSQIVQGTNKGEYLICIITIQGDTSTTPPCHSTRGPPQRLRLMGIHPREMKPPWGHVNTSRLQITGRSGLTTLLSSQQTGLAWHEEPDPAPMAVMGLQLKPSKALGLLKATPSAPRIAVPEVEFA